MLKGKWAFLVKEPLYVCSREINRIENMSAASAGSVSPEQSLEVDWSNYRGQFCINNILAYSHIVSGRLANLRQVTSPFVHHHVNVINMTETDMAINNTFLLRLRIACYKVNKY